MFGKLDEKNIPAIFTWNPNKRYVRKLFLNIYGHKI